MVDARSNEYVFDCLGRTLAMAASLREWAVDGGADVEVGGKLYAMGVAVFPLALWHIDALEFAGGADGLLSATRLGGSALGVARSALSRPDIPSELRRSLYPALRPDRHLDFVQWWDREARPRWLAPFLDDCVRRSTLDAVTIAGSGRFAYRDYEAWDEAHSLAWQG